MATQEYVTCLKAPGTSLCSCQICVLSLNNPGVPQSALLVVDPLPSCAHLRLRHNNGAPRADKWSPKCHAVSPRCSYIGASVCVCVRVWLKSQAPVCAVLQCQGLAFLWLPISWPPFWAPHHGFPGHVRVNHFEFLFHNNNNTHTRMHLHKLTSASSHSPKTRIMCDKLIYFNP